MCIYVLKVASYGEHDVIRPEVIRRLRRLGHELRCSESRVVLGVVRGIDEGAVIDPVSLEVQVLWGPVDVVDHHESEQLSSSSKMGPGWSP